MNDKVNDGGWTRGEWRLVPLPADRRIEIMDGAGYLIGAAFDNNGDPQNQANAHLIRTAPELYEALENLVRNNAPEHVEAARAALAKARGAQ